MTAQDASPANADPAPWSFAARFGGRGWVSDLDGPVHWVEFAGSSRPAPGSDSPPIVFVHGLGGSHLNWSLIGPELSADRRAYALDLHGFGMSPGVGNSGVRANARLVNRFLREVVGRPAVLVGNSMGGMISILHTAAHPENVAGLVLVDPAIPGPAQRPDARVAGTFLAYTLPGLGEAYMRVAHSRYTTRELVERVIDLCFAVPSRASRELIDAAAELAAARRSIPGIDQAFLHASRSLMRIQFRPRIYREQMGAIRVPVLLIHGDRDRLVPIAAARDAAARNPGWDTLFLPDVGHTPQMETPDLVIDAVQNWLWRNPGLMTG